MESNFIDWHPADIIAGLRKKGTSMAAESRRNGLLDALTTVGEFHIGWHRRLRFGVITTINNLPVFAILAVGNFAQAVLVVQFVVGCITR